jgi:hypothetical protein
MLGICFFAYRGEYTGEPVWEGEKGVVRLAPSATARSIIRDVV